MNFIAGGLLIFLEEENAFWMLCYVVENLLSGYFSKTYVGEMAPKGKRMKYQLIERVQF